MVRLATIRVILIGDHFTITFIFFHATFFAFQIFLFFVPIVIKDYYPELGIRSVFYPNSSVGDTVTFGVVGRTIPTPQRSRRSEGGKYHTDYPGLGDRSVFYSYSSVGGTFTFDVVQVTGSNLASNVSCI